MKSVSRNFFKIIPYSYVRLQFSFDDQTNYTNIILITLSFTLALFGLIQAIAFLKEIGKITDFRTNSVFYEQNNNYMQNNIQDIIYDEAVFAKK